MKKTIFVLTCSAIICCSCSESSYLQGSEMDLAELNQQYELAKTAEAVDAEDSLKIETRADDSVIEASMQEYVTELKNRMSIAKEKVMRSSYGTLGSLVGVFKVGSCGTYKEIEIIMDCEDTRGGSSTTGDVGSTYTDKNQNVHFHFCLTEANRFYPGGVLLIDNINYNSLYTGFPMDIIVRHHDTEDKNSSNGYFSTHPQYNTLESISNGLTTINSSGAILAWGFPHMGEFIYPSVPAPYPVVGPSGIEYGLIVKQPSSTGIIYCDDEDKRNKNWAQEYSGGVFKRDITETVPYNTMILSANTQYYVGVSTDETKFYKANSFNFIRHYVR